jgi:hypothetical protein
MEALQNLRHIFRRGRQGRADPAVDLGAGGPQGGPGASGPGEPGYEGEVHLADETIDEAVARPAGPRADRITRKAARDRADRDEPR